MRATVISLIILYSALSAGCSLHSAPVAVTPSDSPPDSSRVRESRALESRVILDVPDHIEKKLDLWLQEYMERQGVEFAFCVIGEEKDGKFTVTDVDWPPQRHAPERVSDIHWGLCRDIDAWGHAHPSIRVVVNEPNLFHGKFTGFDIQKYSRDITESLSRDDILSWPDRSTRLDIRFWTTSLSYAVLIFRDADGKVGYKFYKK